MKKTALTEKHIALNAKMAAFAGYQMPISYAGIKEEHQAVRQRVGLFDVSHMGEFVLSGPAAADLLQHCTSNDVRKLSVGKAQYSCLPNKKGGIVDDLIVYQRGEDEYLLVVNAANIEKDWQWLQAENEAFGAEMKDLSDDYALLAVQGPKAEATLQKLTSTDLSDIPFYTFKEGALAGVENVIISATGYTGSGGFELYLPPQYAGQVWDAILQAGEAFGIQPCGLGARDTLRLEMGYCLYGNDIDDGTSPLEAGLGWITKLQKGDFNSSDIFKKQKAEGVSRKLVGFTLEGKRVPRKGYPIANAEGEIIGEVSSGTMSPSLGYPIGMGYVDTAFAKKDTEIQVMMRKKAIPATVSRPPFLELK